MTDVEIAPLPPVLDEALASLPYEARERVLQHLKGGTSTNWLSDWLGRWGSPVGATTLKTYRQLLRERGVC